MVQRIRVNQFALNGLEKIIVSYISVKPTKESVPPEIWGYPELKETILALLTLMTTLLTICMNHYTT